MIEIDKLRLYRGLDYPITDSIALKTPTLRQIVDYGEREFYNMVYSLVIEPVNMKWQLWDSGIDWTTLKSYEFFCSFIAPTLTNDMTRIVLGEYLDFSKMEYIHDEKIDENILVQNVTISKKIKNESFDNNDKKDFINEQDGKNASDDFSFKIVFDRAVYAKLCALVRCTYGFKQTKCKPANEVTKMAIIEDERDEYLMNKDKPYESTLMNYISTLVNCEGFKHDEKTVFDMNIYAFMDSLKRISKIKNATLLLQSGYSGFGISFKDIDKEELDWTGNI